MEDLLNLLNSIQPLSHEFQQAFSSSLNREVVQKKQWLLRAGDINNKIYFIERGIARSYYLKDGKEITSWFMKEGDIIISIISFYLRQPSYEYIEMLEDGILWSLSYGKLQSLYSQFPEFNYSTRLLTEKYYVMSELRTYGIRMQTAKQRYQELLTEIPTIVNRVPLKYIASHLGLSPETISRLRAKKHDK